MNSVENNKYIGYFLPRKDLIRLNITNLTQELYICLLEAHIIKTTISHVHSLQNIEAFDGIAGDRKCQTRASMIIDILQNPETFTHLSKHRENIISLVHKITDLINNIPQYSQEEQAQIFHYFRKNSFSDYMFYQHLNFEISHNIKILSLILISTFDKNKLLNYRISSKKTDLFLNYGAKATLCDLSIQYERDLAKQYHLSEVETCLQQLEKKGFCTMTSFFPSFKPIIEKMKHLDQPFAKKTTHFCQCGRVRKNSFEIFSYKNNAWIPTHEKMKDLEQPIMVIYGFQFPGSFEKLKKCLNIPLQEISIPKPYHVMCSCNKPFVEPVIDNMEHGILANFAHHPQFTTEAEIDWQGLGLVNSNLHKEYEFLKTLHGFSADDMSKFCINHIYPATIKDAIELDSPSIHINITEQRKDLVTHHDAHCPC